MTELLVWRLISVGAIAVLSFILKQWFKDSMAKLDEIIKAIKDNDVNDEKQNGQIKVLQEVQKTHDKRLDAHSKRIANIENKCR